MCVMSWTNKNSVDLFIINYFVGISGIYFKTIFLQIHFDKVSHFVLILYYPVLTGATSIIIIGLLPFNNVQLIFVTLDVSCLKSLLMNVYSLLKFDQIDSARVVWCIRSNQLEVGSNKSLSSTKLQIIFQTNPIRSN